MSMYGKIKGKLSGQDYIDNAKTVPQKNIDALKDPLDKQKAKDSAAGAVDPTQSIDKWTGGLGKGNSGGIDPTGQLGDIFSGLGGGGSGGAGTRPELIAPADIATPVMSGYRDPSSLDPRTALINQAAQAQFRTQQQNLIGQLALQASGRGPSVAGAQLQQASQANQAATFAQLASARGAAAGNPGLARNAMNTSANIQAQTARDAAVARMQEQMNAQGALAGTLNQARGADIGLATSQAGLQQQSNMAQYNSQIAMAQQYNDLKAKYAAMGLDAQKANQMAALDIQRIAQSNYLADLDRANAQQAASKAQMSQGLGAIAGVAGTIYGGPAGGAIAKTGTEAALDSNYDRSDELPEGSRKVSGGPVYA